MKFTGERFMPSKLGSIALQHYHRYVFALNQIDIKNKIVLDIACGEGYGTNLISKTAKQVFGVDISEETIEFAEKKYNNVNTKYLVGEAANIPLPDNSIDIVISFETIEHHDKHKEMMVEIKRVLNPRGVLIISSPDKAYYEKHFPNIKNEFHVKELYKNDFFDLMQRNFNFNYHFLQNNFFGSIITIDSKKRLEYKIPVYSENINSKQNSLESRFNICISSNQEIETKQSTSLFSNGLNHDPLSEIEILKSKIEGMYNSSSWKIGYLILTPFRLIKKTFKL